MRASNDAPDHAGEDRLIDLYFGLLSDPAAQQVLAHLRVCADCESRFRSLVREREEVRASGAPRLVGGAVLLPPGEPEAARSPTRVRFAAAVMAAAAVLALAFLWLGYLAPGAAPGEYWLPLDRESVALRAGPLPTDLERFRAGLEAYGRRDAGRAVEALEGAEVPENYTRLRDLFLASALTLRDRPDEAIAVLERLRIERLPMPWRARARWVWYTALRDGGRAEQAATLLDELAARDDEIAPLARQEHRRLGRRRAVYSGSPNSTNPDQ